MPHIQNAQIEDASIEIEGHGILSSMIHLNYGGSAQGFGGYSLERDGLSSWVRNMFRVTGVDNWSALKGKNVRVEQDRPFGKILRIGHFMKDEWFNPAEDL